MNETQRPQEPVEQEAVRTTIVGGRPPGCGKGIGMIPRGIEVLVKKAAVDVEFRQLLLEKRSAAADAIGLILQPAEAMLLGQIPAAQLELIIASTYVEPTKIPTFLGRVAAAMILAISAGASVTMAQNIQIAKGVRNDRPPVASTAPATAPADANEGPTVYGWRAQASSTQPATAEGNAPLERPKIVEERIGARADVPAEVGANKGQRADMPSPKPDPNAKPTSLPAIDSALLAKLVAQLDSANADERAAANQKIMDMGKSVVPHLQRVRQGSKLSPETSVRIDAIIEKLGGSVSSVAPADGMPDELRVQEGTRIQVPRQAPPPPVAPQAAGSQPASQPASRPAAVRVAGLQACIAGDMADVPATAEANAPVERPREVRPTKGATPDMPFVPDAPKTQPATAEANAVVERPVEVQARRGVRADVPPAVDPAAPKPTPASLPAIDSALLTKLIAQLDSENADERAAANQKIIDMGKNIVPHLRQVRQGSKLSPEASVRIDAIIEKLGGPQPAPPDASFMVTAGAVVQFVPPPKPAPPPASQPSSQPATQPAPPKK